MHKVQKKQAKKQQQQQQKRRTKILQQTGFNLVYFTVNNKLTLNVTIHSTFYECNFMNYKQIKQIKIGNGNGVREKSATMKIKFKNFSFLFLFSLLHMQMLATVALYPHIYRGSQMQFYENSTQYKQSESF